MFLPPDHFQLFDLPPRFALDTAALDSAYRSVQGQVHPDRFASGTAAENRVAMQWATQANEAYRTLKSPLRRAAYLCERAGVPIDAESNTTMPTEFLSSNCSGARHWTMLVPVVTGHRCRHSTTKRRLNVTGYSTKSAARSTSIWITHAPRRWCGS